MRTPHEITQVLELQRAWAKRAGLRVDAYGRVERLEDNLFEPLHQDTRLEYEGAAGNELAGDIRSLRSSAALVCNFFDPWRSRDASTLGSACVGDPRASKISFERTFPTGLRGTPPHLDVVLEGSPSGPVAIESKFTEPYGPPHNEFRESYFAKPEIWRGLERCKHLAREMAEGQIRFERLGAAQLLKHILGLNRAYGSRMYDLVYLWFEVPGDGAAQHAREVEHFARRVEQEVRFRAFTYQHLAQAIQDAGGSEPDHIAYLKDRYGLPSAEAGRPARQKASRQTESHMTLERAIEIAAQAHAGQTDKGGAPYILHPLRLMLRAANPEERIVAVLHDVLEDSDWTADALRKEGLSPQILEALLALEKRPNEAYPDFIERCRSVELARQVKILDVQDNMDLSRIDDPGAADFARVRKYEAALGRLLDEDAVETRGGPIRMIVTFDESVRRLSQIAHEHCQNARPRNWKPGGRAGVTAQSICWLFCWAKTGQGSLRAAETARAAFSEIFDRDYEWFEARVPHEWARATRYAERPVEEQLSALLAG